MDYLDTVVEVTNAISFRLVNFVPGNFTMRVLARVGRELRFEACASLTSLAFESLATTGSKLDITQNTNLASVSFPRLVSTGTFLRITYNSNLASASFPSLVSTGTNLCIGSKPKLTSLQFRSIARIGADAAANAAYLQIYSSVHNNGQTAITSPACQALKDACRKTPQCNGNPRNNDPDGRTGPNLKWCN